MGDRSYSARRSSGLRLLTRLVSVVAALFVLCVTGRASAANLAVPMCGDHNESVAAPPIFRLTDDGSIRATPCHAADGFGVSQNAPTPPERAVVYERPERVLGFRALLVAQNDSVLLSIAGASQALERPGFVGTLFRPPRA
jgi:hypothetical protein